MPSESPRIGYVLKMYPRISETFILTELLAHEAAGVDIEIFSLKPPTDGRFHEALSRVRAPATYLARERANTQEFWSALRYVVPAAPDPAALMALADTEDARNVHRGAELARRARERGITHLHAHFGTDATSVARVASRLTGIPYTFTAHAKDIFHESVDPDDLRRKLRDAAGVVTVSEFNARFLEEQYGADAAGVERIYNGLDVDEFAFSSPEDRPPVILGVGRLVEKKGFEDLVDACAILARSGRAFDCAIIGEGERRAAIEARIRSCGVGDRVTLLGARPRHEVIAHLGGAAVMAAPCVVAADGNRDGLPTVLIEAMCMGTPCVSTPVTGIPEIVRDEDTGLLVPERDAEALASALARCLDEPATRVALAQRARTLVETEFDIGRNTERMREMFARCAACRPVPQVAS